MANIFETPIEFIEYSIKQALMINIGEIKQYVGDLQRVYFCGATLCLDTKDEFGNLNVYTINHSDEDFGLFSGGLRRLLTIKALKNLEQLMVNCNINHTPKWLN
jgi:hypothetical protein